MRLIAHTHTHRDVLPFLPCVGNALNQIICHVQNFKTAILCRVELNIYIFVRMHCLALIVSGYFSAIVIENSVYTHTHAHSTI